MSGRVHLTELVLFAVIPNLASKLEYAAEKSRHRRLPRNIHKVKRSKGKKYDYPTEFLVSHDKNWGRQKFLEQASRKRQQRLARSEGANNNDKTTPTLEKLKSVVTDSSLNVVTTEDPFLLKELTNESESTGRKKRSPVIPGNRVTYQTVSWSLDTPYDTNTISWNDQQEHIELALAVWERKANVCFYRVSYGGFVSIRFLGSKYISPPLVISG